MGSMTGVTGKGVLTFGSAAFVDVLMGGSCEVCNSGMEYGEDDLPEFQRTAPNGWSSAATDRAPSTADIGDVVDGNLVRDQGHYSDLGPG